MPEGESAQNLEGYDRRIPVEIKPGIFIRLDHSTNILLLKHNYAREIYRYDVETEKISQTAENDWSKSDGNITVCRVQGSVDYNLKSIY